MQFKRVKLTQMRTTDEIVQRCSREIERRGSELASGLIEMMTRAGRFPDWMQASPVLEATHSLTAESIVAEQRLLRRDELPDELPAADSALVEEAVNNASPVAMMIDGYRAGNRVQSAAWQQAVDEKNLDPELARAVIERAENFMFAYAGRMTELVTEAYVEGRQRRLRTTDHLRQSTVRALLDGERPTDNPLDYPAAGEHIAVVAGGEAELEEFNRLAARLDAKPLVLDAYSFPWWGWLGRSGRFDGAPLAPILKAFSELGHAGISSVEPSYEGFRESHRQALAAFAVSRARGRPVRFDEIAAEDLACRDREAARSFVEARLGCLADSSARADRLRETLLAYFASGHNNRAAAAQLGVHHQTVAQRLASVEADLGAPITELRLDLELALRAERFLEATEGLGSS